MNIQIALLGALGDRAAAMAVSLLPMVPNHDETP